jgi:hypothetical protein
MKFTPTRKTTTTIATNPKRNQLNPEDSVMSLSKKIAIKAPATAKAKSFNE